MILLYEDGADLAKELLAVMQAHAGNAFDVQQCEEPNQKQTIDVPYEDFIADKVLGPVAARVALVVVDRDLHKQANGLSERTVSEAASRLGIPMARYARIKRKGTEEKLNRLGAPSAWTEIELDFDRSPEEFGRDVIGVANGVIAIARALDALPEEKLKSGPASLLAQLLGAPEIESRLVLYATSDMSALERVGQQMDPKDQRRYLATFLSYWLRNVILRFPGALVSEVAAGSYLNIDPAGLLEQDVLALFQAARYEGPFSETRPFWWRHRLDQLLEDEGVTSGLELVERRGITAKPALCAETQTPSPRYTCVVTDEPISAEASIGNLRWLPRGADLSRVRQSVYEMYAPWLNL